MEAGSDFPVINKVKAKTCPCCLLQRLDSVSFLIKLDACPCIALALFLGTFYDKALFLALVTLLKMTALHNGIKEPFCLSVSIKKRLFIVFIVFFKV